MRYLLVLVVLTVGLTGPVHAKWPTTSWTIFELPIRSWVDDYITNVGKPIKGGTVPLGERRLSHENTRLT